MLLALLLSLSRSGALALVVAAAGTQSVTWRAMERRHARLLAAAIALAAVLAVSWAGRPAIRDRLVGGEGGVVNRLVIWNGTLPLLQDCWSTGVGAGAYEIAMRVYQRSDRAIYVDQAHNHYLQVAAEGGLLLLIPVAVALVAFVRAARAQIRVDRSPIFWIRVGAACGLGAVALQSGGETGLVMSANSALAAILAAIVVHQRRADSNEEWLKQATVWQGNSRTSAPPPRGSDLDSLVFSRSGIRQVDSRSDPEIRRREPEDQ
jgi:O-antigen ligase